MQSRTSFFNQTLFRRNLTRFWPLWVVPSFVGALFPLAMLTQLIRYDLEGLFGSGSGSYALQFTSIYYDVAAYAVPIISLCYAVLVALAVWSYLFNNRSTGLMHTLPIGREGLFLTNFLSGMTMMLAPYVVTGLLCVVISLAYGFFDPVGLLVTILAVIGDSLFYFSSATAVAFITGNVFALPVLYFIFHFLAAGMDFLVSVFADGFLFGLNGDYTGTVEFLSPTVSLFSHVGAHRESDEVVVPNTVHGSLTAEGMGYYDSRIISVTLENAWVVAVYALVGLVLLAAAYALYRRRRSECAGDVVAVGWMKPVFRYGVALCAAMAGGLALYAVFWGQFQSGEYYDVIPLLAAMLIAGAIGYYAASMLLAKSLRAFRGSWKGLGVTALCAAAICGVLKFDLLGIETRVPAMDQIESVVFRAADNQYDLTPEEDAELIEEIRAVHGAIAGDADYIIAMGENWTSGGEEDLKTISMHNYIRLTYHLKNGTKVIRYYYVPLTEQRLTQEGTYDRALDQLVNSDAMKAKRFHLDDGYQPESGSIYLEGRRDGNVVFGTREAQILQEAVRKDIAAGTCGVYDWFEDNRGGRYAMELTLEFRIEEKRDNGAVYDYYDAIMVAVYPRMTHTVAALMELGMVEERDLKTYAELYPEEYDETYWEFQEKFGVDISYDDYMSIRGEAASIGVIGGADGPTAIMVTGG